MFLVIFDDVQNHISFIKLSYTKEFAPFPNASEVAKIALFVGGMASGVIIPMLIYDKAGYMLGEKCGCSL